MSLTELMGLFAEMDADREARTRRERHGLGEITLLDNVPTHATGCCLPDGSLTDAECLTRHEDTDAAHRVWIRRLAGSAMRRRGRLKVEPGTALLFVDESDADVDASSRPPVSNTPSLERDLAMSDRVCGLIRSDVFSVLLYGALCNTSWRHKSTGATWHCSWRGAGGIVAELRGEGCYTDWYCSSGEGLVDEHVLAEIGALGWALVEADAPDID
jgi:hypothetical protein